MDNRSSNENNSVENNNFDLSKLEAAEQAIVCGFEPETFGLEFPSALDQALPFFEQYEDMYAAYRYAKDSLLPEIHKIGISNITEENILLWINELHKRIAAVLLKTTGSISGKYTDKQILRWTNTKIRDLSAAYLGGEIEVDILQKACNAEKIQFSATWKLILLLKSMDQRSVTLSSAEIAAINPEPPFFEPLVKINKLVKLYHADQLSKREKDVLNSAVKVCMPAEKIPSAMQDYAKNIVDKLKKCNKDNIEEVAELAFTAFYFLTEIHPYENGNGRVATCWMNVLLRALGYPGILMRYPNERDDPNSNYSKAIASIKNKNNSPLLLDHIKTRIKEAQNEKTVIDSKFTELACVRVQLRQVLRQLEKEYPKPKLIALYNTFLKAAVLAAQKAGFGVDVNNMEKCYSNDFSIYTVKFIVDKLQNFLRPIQPSSPLLSFHQPKFNPQLKVEVITKLKSLLVGETGTWKAYAPKDKNLIVHLTLKTLEEAQDFFKQAKNLNNSLLAIGLAVNKETKENVVTFEILDLSRFLDLNACPMFQQGGIVA